MAEVNRIQIPFVVDTLEENPPEEGKFVSRPVVGATVVITNRRGGPPPVVSAVEAEESPIEPTTDENGRINGWVEEGAYLITVSGGKPFIAAQHMAWDALSGRGIENKSVGEASIHKADLKADTNHNDTESVLEFLIPTGVSLDFRGESAPAGFLLENGASYSTTEYNRLFKVIGYKYGGSGANFNVPDSRGRVTVGAGTGVGLTVRVLAAKEGTETVAITEAQLAAHTHGQVSVGGSASVSGSVSGSLGGSIADHVHGKQFGQAFITWDAAGQESAAPRYLSKSSAGETKVLWGNAGINTVTGGMTGATSCSVSGTLSGSMGGSIATNPGTTNSTGAGEAHSNMQPFLVAQRIIKT
jgi:microcystin-dependent protein